MKCLYPFYVDQFKNVTIKGYPCKVRVGSIQVPCGRCPPCRRRKQNEWAFRCQQEALDNKMSVFVTLTYDDVHLPLSDSGEATLCKRHLQKYFKDLRYWLGDIRYFSCGEYGDSFGRPHYHALVFYNGSKRFDEVDVILRDRWKYGISKVDYGITPANAKYVCKYSMKSLGFDYRDCVPPFALMSRRPGIGKGFLKRVDIDVFRKMDLWHVHDQAGTPYALPRIYKPFFYTEEECYQHSLLLQKQCYTRERFSETLYHQSNFGNFYQTELEITLSIEKQFIKKLKNELYGFKYVPINKRSRPERYRSDPRDFEGCTDFSF